MAVRERLTGAWVCQLCQIAVVMANSRAASRAKTPTRVRPACSSRVS